MENKYNTISFCQEDYREYNTYSNKQEINESALWEDIATFLRIATKNGYQFKIWYDGTTIVVEYNYRDPEMGDSTLEWVGADEYIESINDA